MKGINATAAVVDGVFRRMETSSDQRNKSARTDCRSGAPGAAQIEGLQLALQRSISHDLRTPLASILGCVTSLRAYRRDFDDAAQDQLLGIIYDETERLSRYITNLLDMTRLEAGAISPRLELVHLDEIIGGALRRAYGILAGRGVVLELANRLPLVRVNPILFEQVLFNLLDNAAKYACPGTEVRIRTWCEACWVHVAVLDESNGICPIDLERIFEKFYRIERSDHGQGGSGLGLAICRGFVEAMGGEIVAGNRSDPTGSIFTITFSVDTLS
jgi:two-component system, OmpR family, sensor histidine kinase KdpD